MTVSNRLDLSLLPPFSLVEVDAEAMRSAHIASLKVRFEERGIPWDVDQTAHDPAILQIEEITAWRVTDLTALNDAGKSLTLAHAWGGFLDHLAATLFPDLDLKRLQGESDERFKRRITLAPEARSEVTPGSYVFKALTADVRIADARALNYASGLVPVGEILVTILPEEQHMGAQADLVLLARDAIMADRVRLASEVITVRAATAVDTAIAGTLHISRGPDRGLVKAEAEQRLTKYRAERRRIGRVLPRSGLMGALHAGGVEFVVLPTPAGDIDPGPDGWVRVTSVTVDTEVAT